MQKFVKGGPVDMEAQDIMVDLAGVCAGCGHDLLSQGELRESAKEFSQHKNNQDKYVEFYLVPGMKDLASCLFEDHPAR